MDRYKVRTIFNTAEQLIEDMENKDKLPTLKPILDNYLVQDVISELSSYFR